MAKSKDVTHIKDLVADPNNRRKHNPRNVGMIAEALNQVGAARSIVIDEHDTVLAGNGLVEAAAQVDITKVQVVEVDGETIVAVRRKGLTDAQKRALALFDNRSAELAEWNVEQLQADVIDGLPMQDFFTPAELMDIGLTLPEGTVGAAGGAGVGAKAGDDDVPVAKETSIKTGDLFALGNHRLLCGNATNLEDVMRVMGGASADCVFTSPPYAVGIDYGTYEDSIENLRKMLPLLAKTWVHIVKPSGFAVVNFGDIVSGKHAAGSDHVCMYPMAIEYWPAFRQADWALWAVRIWCKPGMTTSMHIIGNNRAAYNFEYVWTWIRPDDAPPPVVDKVDEGDYQSWQGHFETAPKLDVGLDEHGAGMPVDVAMRMITIHSAKGGVVYEPFTGTGTTIIAAERTGRVCYGTELNPKFCQIIIDRWEKATGIKAVKIEE